MSEPWAIAYCKDTGEVVWNLADPSVKEVYDELKRRLQEYREIEERRKGKP